MKEYPCETCGKVYKQQAHLDRHLQKKVPCSVVKDFVCACGKTYFQAAGLSRHKRACNAPQQTLEEQTLETATSEDSSHDNAASNEQTDSETESVEITVAASNSHRDETTSLEITAFERATYENAVDLDLQNDTLDVHEANIDGAGHLSQAITSETAFFKLGDKKIRKTLDEPQRVSVYDLISAITDQNLKHARSTFDRMKASYPEVALLKQLFGRSMTQQNLHYQEVTGKEPAQ